MGINVITTFDNAELYLSDAKRGGQGLEGTLLEYMIIEGQADLFPDFEGSTYGKI